MSSHLTTVAYYSRKAIRYGVYIFVFLVFFSAVMVPLAIKLYKNINPPQPLFLSSNRAKIPAIVFPEIQEYQYQFSFQTANNSLPDFPDRAFIFYISPQKNLGFSTKTDVEQTAATLGFTDAAESLGDYKYQWSKKAPAPLTLIIDAKNNYSAQISYQWQNDSALKSTGLNPNKENLSTQVLRVVENLGIELGDVEVDNPQYIYFEDGGNVLKETRSLSDADFVRLDFFKENITYQYNDIYFYKDIRDQEKFNEIVYDYKIVTDKAMQANVYAVLSGASNRAQHGIIDAKISQSNVDYLNPLPYYLKPVKTAKIELENGNAYIANLPKDESQPITIRRVYLAYYDSSIYQEYLQPVYIFSESELFDGKNVTLDPGFVAYVPAVRADQVQNK